LEAQGICSGYSLKYGGGYFKSHRTAETLFTTEEIFKAAYALILQNPPKTKVYMLGVSVTRLKPLTGQLNLFFKAQNKSLSMAMDQINDKFGEYTVFAGRMWGLSDQAHDRIGFRKSVPMQDKSDLTFYDKE